MSIDITNDQDLMRIDEARFAEDVRTLACAAGWMGELSVAVVDDAAIREINARFLDHDWETDVIAFPLSEDEGEVVVSAERALEEAAERGEDPMAELLLYIVHGILHLLGHDDHEPEEAAAMHALSLDLLRKAGYENTIPAVEREGKS